jgi:hypothetical protein
MTQYFFEWEREHNEAKIIEYKMRIGVKELTFIFTGDGPATEVDCTTEFSTACSASNLIGSTFEACNTKSMVEASFISIPFNLHSIPSH